MSIVAYVIMASVVNEIATNVFELLHDRAPKSYRQGNLTVTRNNTLYSVQSLGQYTTKGVTIK
jgi:hypothetical protein